MPSLKMIRYILFSGTKNQPKAEAVLTPNLSIRFMYISGVTEPSDGSRTFTDKSTSLQQSWNPASKARFPAVSMLSRLMMIVLTLTLMISGCSKTVFRNFSKADSIDPLDKQTIVRPPLRQICLPKHFSNPALFK